MLKTKYYVAVLTSTLGASTQFYSNNVVNPSQAIVTTWINRAYLERTGNSLSPTQLYVLWSFVVACIPLGAIFGALSTNLITKKVGRRNGLFANGVLNVLGACLVYFAKPVNAPELLIVGRLILGANVGLGSGIVPMYLMEITPLKYRGAAGTAHEIAIAFSDSFSMLMALPEILGDEQYWPLAYAFPGVPALFLCLLILSCPESPKYTLITRGKREKAMSDLEKLVDSEQAKSMIDALDQEAHNLSENRPTFADLFAKELRLPLFITVWMMIAQQFTGIAAVFAYSTDMFSSAGLSPPIARYSTLALGIVYFVSTCSAAYLIERLGRRRLSIFQLSSITVVLGLVSVFAWLQQTNQAFWLAYTMIALFVVYMSVYGIGSPIPWMITGEIFPTNFRPMAVTVTVFVSFANAFIVSLGYLPLKQAVGVSISYLPFIVISGISSALVYFLLPETKNRTSTSIMENMEQRFSDSKSQNQQKDCLHSSSANEETEPLKSKKSDDSVNNYLSVVLNNREYYL